jgi:hypothetical protein
MRGDVTATFAGPRQLVYVVPTAQGAVIKKLDLATGGSRTLLATDLQVLRAALDGRGRLVCEARSTTPSGRSTVQLFEQDGRSGALTPLLPPDESMRFGLAMVGGTPTYIVSKSWKGAFAGVPWGKPYRLCQAGSGRESFVADLPGVADTYSPSTPTTTVPILVYAGPGSDALLLVDAASRSVRRVGEYAATCSASLSPGGSAAAMLFSEVGSGVGVVEVDVRSGQVKDTYPVSGRVIQVMYGPDGALYALAGFEGSGSATLLKVENGRLENVMELR